MRRTGAGDSANCCRPLDRRRLPHRSWISCSDRGTSLEWHATCRAVRVRRTASSFSLVTAMRTAVGSRSRRIRRRLSRRRTRIGDVARGRRPAPCRRSSRPDPAEPALPASRRRQALYVGSAACSAAERRPASELRLSPNACPSGASNRLRTYADQARRPTSAAPKSPTRSSI